MRKLFTTNEAAKKAVDQFETVDTRTNVAETWISNAETQKTESELATSIQINHLKIDIFDVNNVIEINRVSLQRLLEEKERLEKELGEVKKKVVEEYKSSKDFLDDIVDGSVSTFHEGFRNCQNKVKELFPAIDTALLILSITDPTAEEATKVQEDIRVFTEARPPTTPDAIVVVEAPSNIEAPVKN